MHKIKSAELSKMLSQPFSIELVTKLTYYEGSSANERLIPGMTITRMEGRVLLEKLRETFRALLLQPDFDQLIPQMVEVFCTGSVDTAIDNLILFGDFLSKTLSVEQNHRFCKRIQDSKAIMSDYNRKHLLFQFGSKFGYPPP